MEPPLILSSTLELAAEYGEQDILYIELSVDLLDLSADYLGCTVSIHSQGYSPQSIFLPANILNSTHFACLDAGKEIQAMIPGVLADSTPLKVEISDIASGLHATTGVGKVVVIEPLSSATNDSASEINDTSEAEQTEADPNEVYFNETEPEFISNVTAASLQDPTISNAIVSPFPTLPILVIRDNATLPVLDIIGWHFNENLTHILTLTPSTYSSMSNLTHFLSHDCDLQVISEF
jgi:hypothetical protein